MQYKAMDERGKVSSGRIEAVNVADLELRLSRMGLDLINHREAKVRLGGATGARVKRRELINFCFQLEQLLTAGVAVIEALSDLRDSVEDRALRSVIAGMVESIEGGKTLSGAMEESPQVFDGVFVNLIRAGEFSGNVSAVIRNVTENLKWQDEQAAQVKKLMMYPAFVGGVVMLTLVFLMTYLVPQLVSFIQTMGQELPLRTRVLIATVRFLRAILVPSSVHTGGPVHGRPDGVQHEYVHSVSGRRLEASNLGHRADLEEDHSGEIRELLRLDVPFRYHRPRMRAYQ